jgi:hypothetical protein
MEGARAIMLSLQPDRPLTSCPSSARVLQGWVEHFQHKYTVCGKLIPNP